VTLITFDAIRGTLQTRTPQRIIDPEAAEAAVALALSPTTGNDLEVLLIRRALLEGDPWSGHMALPGGRRHPEDADLMATAIRETREETGITLSSEMYLGDLDEFTPRVQHLPRIVVRPHVFALPGRPELSLSEEVADFRWVSLTELRESYRTVQIDLRGTAIPLPAFVIGPDVVWGLTERILSPFMRLIDKLT
jgi:8-oxo-dGTP pyrophosphatase MutT (NUDIX family)